MTQTVELLEGTWEEIAAHSEEFKGRRLQVLILPEKKAAQAKNGAAKNDVAKNDVAKNGEKQPQSLAEALAGRIGTVSFGPEDGSERVEEIWGEYVEEKYRTGKL